MNDNINNNENNDPVTKKEVKNFRKNLFKIALVVVSVIVTIIIFTLIPSKGKVAPKITENNVAKESIPKQVVSTAPVKDSTPQPDPAAPTTPKPQPTPTPQPSTPTPKPVTPAVFNKSAKDIVADLKSNNAGIPVGGAITCLITYGKDDSRGLTQITNAKDFKIVSSTAEGTTWQHLTLYIDADFIQNAPNDMYENNGTYTAKGEFKALYQLDQTKNEWVFSSISSFPDVNSTKN